MQRGHYVYLDINKVAYFKHSTVIVVRETDWLKIFLNDVEMDKIKALGVVNNYCFNSNLSFRTYFWSSSGLQIFTQVFYFYIFFLTCLSVLKIILVSVWLFLAFNFSFAVAYTLFVACFHIGGGMRFFLPSITIHSLVLSHLF